jgi:hypothetical protein
MIKDIDDEENDRTWTRLSLRFTVGGGLEEIAANEIRSTLNNLLIQQGKQLCCSNRPADNDEKNDGTSAEDIPHKKVVVATEQMKISIERGNSGSRIIVQNLTLQRTTLTHDLGSLLSTLRFVDYVSLHLGSIQQSHDDDTTTDVHLSSGINFSRRINESSATTSDVLLSQLQMAAKKILYPGCIRQVYITIWHPINFFLQQECSDDIGLDPLPGILLPTPVEPTTIDNDHQHGTPHKNDHNLSVDRNMDSQERQPPQVLPQLFHVNTIYTKVPVAEMVVMSFRTLVKKHCCPSVDEDNILWLDAGAGSGALLQHLPPYQRIGIDIQPSSVVPSSSYSTTTIGQNEIFKIDFFDVTQEWLKQQQQQQQSSKQRLGPPPLLSSSSSPCKILCVISNPPFTDDSSSRGNYRPIVQFIHHAFHMLDASFVGVIVPTKFARLRVMQSLGLNIRTLDNNYPKSAEIQLVARFVLPKDSFYDPSLLTSTRMASLSEPSASKNIDSCFLFFRRVVSETSSTGILGNHLLEDTEGNVRHPKEDFATKKLSTKQHHPKSFPRVRVEGHRNKKDFPELSTKDLSQAIQSVINRDEDKSEINIIEGRQKNSHYDGDDVDVLTIAAELSVQADRTVSPSTSGKVADMNQITSHSRRWRIDFFLLLNPKRPLSLVNCTSRRVNPVHSLGWLSTSVKPSIAVAINQLALLPPTRSRGGIFDTIESMIILTPLSTSGVDTKQNDDRLLTPIGNENKSSTHASASKASLVVNAMCGEGTIEFESFDDRSRRGSYLLLSGDKSEGAVYAAKDRFQSLTKSPLLNSTKSTASSYTIECDGDSPSSSIYIDFVIWDAQRLPLREGIADAFLGDLPIAGSVRTKRGRKRPHQYLTNSEDLENADVDNQNSAQNKLDNEATDSMLSYKRVSIEAVRVLVPRAGRAVLVSVDTNSLTRSVLDMTGQWKVLLRHSVTIGGLPGKMFAMQRNPPPTKDISVWLPSATTLSLPSGTTFGTGEEAKRSSPWRDNFDDSLCTTLLQIAKKSCEGFWLDDLLELHHSVVPEQQDIVHLGQHQRQQRSAWASSNQDLVRGVELIDVYTPATATSEEEQQRDKNNNIQSSTRISHCYRISFDSLLSNYQAKILEREIRTAIEKDPPYNILLR